MPVPLPSGPELRGAGLGLTPSPTLTCGAPTGLRLQSFPSPASTSKSSGPARTQEIQGPQLEGGQSGAQEGGAACPALPHTRSARHTLRSASAHIPSHTHSHMDPTSPHLLIDTLMLTHTPTPSFHVSTLSPTHSTCTHATQAAPFIQHTQHMQVHHQHTHTLKHTQQTSLPTIHTHMLTHTQAHRQETHTHISLPTFIHTQHTEVHQQIHTLKLTSDTHLYIYSHT